ncbi:ComEA family DNA-binding protein, partial [Rhodoferax saidenbachensis]|uniref:Competence protein ComE n=1 Tax=Rhodoferax saidenbachensis TaxID=1484693 RepID=A0A1P8K8B4_9BURK
MLKRCLMFLSIALLSAASFAAVEVNQATEAELDSIRGLGPSSTARILKAREQGAFKDWADFMVRVKGLKPATAAKLSKAGLTVQGSPYAGTP